MIAIIGAGLTGLSAARHLGPRQRYAIFEQQDAVGGLCRSPSAGGFTFDHTGHLLHLRDDYTRQLVGSLLRGNLVKLERRAAIYCSGAYLPFPFQAHLHGLPQAERLECLEGFVQAWARRQPRAAHDTFHAWVQKTFGPGIARRFFLPYNEKLFCCSLGRITAEWAGWSVPQPTLRQVLQGAVGLANAGLGYNAEFFYPERGGIEVLPQALAAKAKNVYLGARLVSVSARDRLLRFQDGTVQHYDRLVSTMPLPGLLRLIHELPPHLAPARRRLSASTVHNLNIGINRPAATPYHWIYFPEPEFPFYRVGCYSNFTPAAAPRHASSFYVEIASRRGAAVPYAELRAGALAGLRRCGILRRGDRVIAEQYNRIEPGYVVFDRFRRERLGAVLAWLRKHGILSAGRYGGWTYCSMEDNILQGRALAEALR